MTAAQGLQTRTLAEVELTAYLGTVAGLVTLALAAMRVVVGQLGRRIEEQGVQLGVRIEQQGAELGARIEQQGVQLGARIEQQGAELGTRIEQQGAALGAQIEQQGALLGVRIGRIEEQNDAILGAVGDLGQRVAHLEGRTA